MSETPPQPLAGDETAMHSGAEADPVHAAVRALQHPEALLRRLRGRWADAGFAMRDCAVIQTHYKPGERARLLAHAEVEFTGRPPKCKRKRKSQFLFVQVFADTHSRERALARNAFKRSHTSFGPAFTVLKDLDAVVWALPNGPRMHITRTFFRPKKYARFLVEHGLLDELPQRPKAPELTRFVPRKRALFRDRRTATVAPIWIKVYRAGEDRAALTNLQLLAAAPALGFRVPTVLAHSAKRRAVVVDEMPGRHLSDRHDDSLALGFVGAALSSLHGSAIEPTRHWSAQHELAAFCTACSDIVTAVPELVGRLTDLTRAIAARFDETPAAPETAVHGNLFGDQILTDGPDLAIVDWDDLCRGEPWFDLGRLMAHSIFLGIRRDTSPARVRDAGAALLAGWSHGRGASVNAARLCAYVAAALVLRTKISALRTLAPGWRAETARVLEEANRVLHGASAWFPS